MAGEKILRSLISNMAPRLNEGDYVFVTVHDLSKIDRDITILEFKEAEGVTVVLKKNQADALQYTYDYVASWITLEVHSSLEAVGLTAAFSTELADYGISCNVIAGYYHDHIFVAKKDGLKAIEILRKLSERYK